MIGLTGLLFNRRRNRRAGGLVGLIVGLGLLGFSLLFLFIFFIPAAQARLSGVKTIGTVQDISECTDDSGGDVALRSMIPLDDNVQPTIQFTANNGQSYTVDDSICGNYDIGEQVVLWYVPSNPNNISLDQDQTSLVVLGVVFGGMGLIALIVVLISLGRMAYVGLMMSRSGGQPNAAYAASPAPAGGWQANNPQQMGGWQGNAPGQVRVVRLGGAAQMGGWQMGGQPQMGVGASHRLGEAVFVAGQWAVTLTNAYPSQGAELVSAMPGRFYLMLPIVLRNVSQQPLNYSQTTFRLADSLGAEYQRAPLLEGASPGFIQQGDQASVTLAFDVSGAQRQFRLSFYLSTSSMAQATWDIQV